MKDYSTYIGFDVAAEKSAVAVAVAGRAKAQFLYNIASNYREVGRVLAKYPKGQTLCCYEAGPTGYGLQRYIASRGYDCEVVAPSLIPHKPGEHVKTNRRDAVELAELSRAGQLTAVWVPSAGDEAVRDLVRGRADAKDAEKVAKQQLNSFLLKHGKHYTGTKWTVKHWQWIRAQEFAFEQQRYVVVDYIDAIERASERVQRYEAQMEATLKQWSLKPVIEALMALRGVNLITAMSIVAELGDLARFSTARELMKYLGLTPSEDSTGERHRRGGITKAGNSTVRKLLIESAWCYRHKPCKSYRWKERNKNVSQEMRDISWKAQQRLHLRYWRLTNRKLLPQKVVVAVARELAGFVWAVAQAYHAAQQKKAA